MKPKIPLHSTKHLLYTSAIAIAITFLGHATAADVTWDISGAAGITGGAGTWDTTITNWTTNGGASNVAWVNANNDTAVFGATGGIVTVGTGGVTVGGLTFNSNTYSFAVNANVITFAGTTPTITSASGISTTIVAGIAGSNGLTKDGAGTVILQSASSALNGPLVVNAGVIGLNTATVLTNIVGTSSNSALTMNGGALQYLVGSGQTATQTFSGTTFNAGYSTVQTNKQGATGAGTLNLGTVTRTVGATANFFTSGNGTTTRRIQGNFTASSTILDSGVAYATFVNQATSAATPTLVGNDWAAYGTGAAATVQIATYTASTASALSGNADIATGIDTTLAADTSIISLHNNLAQARTVTIGAANTLTTGGILIGSTVAANTTNITGGTLRSAATVGGKDLVIITHNAGNTAIASVIANAAAGSTGLSKSGVGTVTLSNANTFTGSTILSDGTLSLTNSLALQNSAFDTTKSIVGTSTAGLKTDQTTLTLGGLTGNKNLSTVFTTSSGGYSAVTALTLNPGTGSLTYSGAITNGASGMTLTKSGAGTQTLSGVNTYTGKTTISGGTLALDATGTIDNTSEVSLGTSGNFDVSAKSGYTVTKLSGSGSVAGLVNVSTELAIGNSPGMISFGNGLTLGTSATYSYELNGGTTGASSADLGNVNGLLTIGTGTILDLTQLGTYTVNDKFTLFSYDTLSGTFSGLADGAQFTDAGGIWQINYNDTAGTNGGTETNFITVTAIPEPNAAALLGGLGMFALLRRRRN